MISLPTKRYCASVAKPFAAGLDVDEELAAYWQTVVSGPIGKLLCRAAYDDPQSVGLSAEVARQLGESGRRLVVHRERPFAVLEGDVLVNGSLDRLVTWQSQDGQVLAADLIDFKTDRASGAASSTNAWSFIGRKCSPIAERWNGSLGSSPSGSPAGSSFCSRA